MRRLLGIGRERPAVGDIAERAAPRAQVSQDHEGRGALAKALSDIGAGRFLAHRVEVVLAENLLDFVEARAGRGRAHADPPGLGKPLPRNDGDGDARLRPTLLFFRGRRHLFSMRRAMQRASSPPSSFVPAAMPSAEVWVTAKPG